MERIFIKIPQQTVDRASPRAEERDRSRFVVPVAFFLFDITVSHVRVLQHWVKMGNIHSLSSKRRRPSCLSRSAATQAP